MPTIKPAPDYYSPHTKELYDRINQNMRDFEKSALHTAYGQAMA